MAFGFRTLRFLLMFFGAVLGFYGISVGSNVQITPEETFINVQVSQQFTGQSKPGGLRHAAKPANS